MKNRNEFSRPARTAANATRPDNGRNCNPTPRTAAFWREDRAQVSAELLIVIAAVLAVAVVLVTQLQKTAKTGRAVLANVSSDAFDEIKKIK